MMMLAMSGLDLFKTSFVSSYPKFQEYAKMSLLYIGAAGIMIQVIKSMRG